MNPTLPATAAIDLLAPPEWVMTDNGAALQRMSEQNSKLPDKDSRRVFDAGLELAARGADAETQQINDAKLQKAEERFTLLIEEMAPNYYGGYTNRANVRVVRKDYANAIADYEEALKLAPLAKDAWVTYLNLGSTKLALNRPGDAEAALRDLERAVQMSKSDRYALLGRGSAYHTLGRWSDAAADYGAVLDKSPLDVQPFWLRYSLDLAESGRRAEALGISRRLSAKFDIEPECNLATCSLLWRDGTAIDRDEALRRWNVAPVVTKRQMSQLDLEARSWPPMGREAARAFLSAAPPVPSAPADVSGVQSP